MLSIPTTGDDPCLIGIDPGSIMLGRCVLYYDARLLIPTKIVAQTYNGNKVGKKAWEAMTHGEKYARIAALKRVLLFDLNDFNPVFVGSESPYYNSKQPAAYGVLMEVLSEIRNTCIQYNPFSPLHLIEPSNVKNAVGAKGGVNKVSVLEAALKIEEITSVLEKPLMEYDEHSVDAIAVAYAMLKKIRAGEEIRME